MKITPMTPMMISLTKFQFGFRSKMVSTLVGDYINTMKTTFDFKFDLYKAVKQQRYTINIEVKRNCQLKNLYFDYL